MKSGQDLRRRIIVANLLVALVGIIVVLVSATVITRASLSLETAEHASGLLSDSNLSPGDLETLSLVAAELLPILRQSFMASLPFAIIIAVVSCLIVSLLLTLAIITPLQRTARSSRRIANGLYSDRLPVEGRDELAQLAISFNQMAEALDQVQQRRVALVGYLSHELRTPLSGVSGYIEGMMDGVFPDTDATLALMYGEVRRMRRLVDDLQALSRVQSGQIALRMGTFELPSFVEQATIKLQPQWMMCGVDVLVEHPEQSLVVYADPDRVDQILLNLLANALANTPEGGKVTVDILQDGDFARVNISDTGNGISAEEMPYIFERYFRAKNTRDHEDSGIGIGLTISRQLTLEMGGELTAQSDGSGKGSTFSFLLPISKSQKLRDWPR